MTDPETTATNWRARADRAMDVIQNHPMTVVGAVCFILGLVIGAATL